MMPRYDALLGEIKFYKSADGYGFVKHPDIAKDIHFASEDVAEKVDFNLLKPGTRVKFRLRESKKGLEAYDVAPLHKPYKLLVDFDREKAEGGTFVRGIVVNGATVWLNVRDGGVFATAEAPVDDNIGNRIPSRAVSFGDNLDCEEIEEDEELEN